MKFRDPRVKDALLQFVLRTIPMIPANETLSLLKALRPEAEIEKQVSEAMASLTRADSGRIHL
jgi:hypothetical protein